jgi:hypothetical protein
MLGVLSSIPGQQAPGDNARAECPGSFHSVSIKYKQSQGLKVGHTCEQRRMSCASNSLKTCIRMSLGWVSKLRLIITGSEHHVGFQDTLSDPGLPEGRDHLSSSSSPRSTLCASYYPHRITSSSAPSCRGDLLLTQASALRIKPRSHSGP